MFVIELTYKVSLAEIDAMMAAHVRFLKKYYASGNFVVSGRKMVRAPEDLRRLHGAEDAGEFLVAELQAVLEALADAVFGDEEAEHAAGGRELDDIEDARSPRRRLENVFVPVGLERAFHEGLGEA